MALRLPGCQSEFISGIVSVASSTSCAAGSSNYNSREFRTSCCPWFSSRAAAHRPPLDEDCALLAARRRRKAVSVRLSPPLPRDANRHRFRPAWLSASSARLPRPAAPSRSSSSLSYPCSLSLLPASSLSSSPPSPSRSSSLGEKKLLGGRTFQAEGHGHFRCCAVLSARCRPLGVRRVSQEQAGVGSRGRAEAQVPQAAHVCRARSASGGMTEKEGWEKRQEEAGEDALEKTDSWQWTLNWNEITPTILVGSCPRSASDVDTIVEKGNVSAILNLQSDLCFAALEIPFESIRKRGVERGVFLARVPIRDFDHADQALMLPEAVRMLNVLVSRGRRVYVHCTAGINRATLTVVGYLTFVQGYTLDDAVSLVKSKRKIAHPYIDCWQEVKKKLLDGRQEELTGLSRKIYEGRCEGGQEGSSQSDWQAAQRAAICRIFARWLEVDLGALDVERELTERRMQSAIDKANALAESAKRQVRDAVKRTAVETTNGTGFSYAAYVADAEKLIEDEEYNVEEPYYPTSSEECDAITRECTTVEANRFEDEWGPDPDPDNRHTAVEKAFSVAQVVSSSSMSSDVVASSASVSASVTLLSSVDSSSLSSTSTSALSLSSSPTLPTSVDAAASVTSSTSSHQQSEPASPDASPTLSTEQSQPLVGISQSEGQSTRASEQPFPAQELQDEMQNDSQPQAISDGDDDAV